MGEGKERKIEGEDRDDGHAENRARNGDGRDNVYDRGTGSRSNRRTVSIASSPRDLKRPEREEPGGSCTPALPSGRQKSGTERKKIAKRKKTEDFSFIHPVTTMLFSGPIDFTRVRSA